MKWSLQRTWAWRWQFLAIMVMVLAAGWPALLDSWSDLQELGSRTQHCDMEQKEAPASFQFLSLHRRIFEWTRRRPATDRVVLLTLDRDLPELQANPCLGRAFTADVLDTLAARQPGAVALDHYYPPHSCDHFPEGTQALRAAAARFPRPLVIGQLTEQTNIDDPYSCECQSPSLEITGPQVRGAFVRLNEDVLEVPLRWVVRPQGAPRGVYLAPEQSYGLAYATALAVEPELGPKLARLTTNPKYNEQPYVNLWQADDLEEQSGIDFLCSAGSDLVKARWKLLCKPETVAMEVAGKAVVLGSAADGDTKLVLGESVPGSVLQARYIAALLGGAYLREWVLWIRLAVAVLLILATELLVLSSADLHAKVSFPDGWEARLKHYRRVRRLFSWMRGWSVMAVIAWLCGTVIAVSVVPIVYHFLPPLGLIATAAITLVGDFRFWVKEAARNRAEGEVAL